MVDDLISNGVDEPYRMFTSRAENRLGMRADNAGDRLSEWGVARGVVGTARAALHAARVAMKTDAVGHLESVSLTAAEAAALGVTVNRDGRRRTGTELLAHPDGGWRMVEALWPEARTLPHDVRASLEADALYRSYTDRYARTAAQVAASDAIAIPDLIIDASIPGLSTELQQKLARRRPRTIGEARRISGMTPAGLALIAAHARRGGRLRRRRGIGSAPL